MADIIQVRRDLAASWTSANPTLAQGEMGYETDTGKMKIGDGSTAWTSLGYFEPVPSTTLDSSDIGVTVQGYSAVLDATTASFTTDDETKLDGIEAGADVTDAANVTAAGALMDSELTNEAAVKALNQGVATTDSPTFAATTINGNITVTGTVDGRDIAADGTKLDGIESGATADQTPVEIKTAYESNLDTNAFTDAEQTKLSGIEAGADVTDAANVEPLVDTHLNTSTATNGQYLGWDGTDYAWSTVSGYTDADVNTHLNTSTALSGEVLSWNGTDYDWVAAGVQPNDNVVFGTVTAADVISNGDVSLQGSIVENVYTLTGTTVALTPTNGTIQTHTLTGATTYTDSLASGESVTLVIPGTTNTVTWPTVSWQGGSAPTLDATNDNIIALFKIGTTLYGTTVWSASGGGGGSSYTDSSVDTHLNTSTAATGEVLSWNGTDYDWVASGGSSVDKLWVPQSTFVAPSKSTSAYAGKGMLFEVIKDVTIYGFQMTGFDTGDTQGFALKMSSSSPSTGSITAVSASSAVVAQPFGASFNQPVGRTYKFTSPVSFVAGDYISLCMFVTSGTGTTALGIAIPNRGTDTYPLNSEYLSYLGVTLFDDGIASAVTTGWVTNGNNAAVVAGTSVLLSD